MAENRLVVSAEALKSFCVRVFEKLDVGPADAEIVAQVLVAANLRGVDSHGVARLRRYVNGIRDADDASPSRDKDGRRDPVHGDD